MKHQTFFALVTFAGIWVIAGCGAPDSSSENDPTGSQTAGASSNGRSTTSSSGGSSNGNGGFDCGDVQCNGTIQYCLQNYVGASEDLSCETVPDACLQKKTCDCLALETGCGCQSDSAGNLFLVCFK